MRRFGLACAVLLGVLFWSAPSRAQDISLEVTHQESNFAILAVDPQGAAYALNLSQNSRRIWMSVDNARTWTFRGEHPRGSFKQMTALSDGTLIADTQTPEGFHLSRSIDRGATWQEVLSLGQARMLTPHSITESGGTAFFLEYQTATSASVPVRLWASTNGGATWSVRFTFQGRRHGHGIRTAPDGALWAFFGDSDEQSGILRSTDGGFTWESVLETEQARVVDAVFANGDLLFGQDIPFQPLFPNAGRLTPEGDLTLTQRLPGPSYSIMALPQGGYLMGITREPAGDVYPPGEAGESAHLLGSVDGTSWQTLASFPRIDASDYARADVYWRLPSGEVVLNLRHVRTLSGGRGYQLLRVNVPPGGDVTFTDDFNACTSTSDLGGAWQVNGVWYCRAGRARGESPGIALARTAELGDTDVSALVQLNGSTGSGVVARGSDGSHYAAVLNSSGRVDLIRTTNGSGSLLATVPATILQNTSYRLRLQVTGENSANVQVRLNDQLVINIADSSPIRSGRPGLISGTTQRTQFDDFVASGTAAGPPPPPPPDSVDITFRDEFDDCTSNVDLGPNWDISGTWYCRDRRARGESTLGFALARTPDLGLTEVQARVQLNGSAGSGVVARVSDGSYYAARIFLGGRVELVRVTPQGTTVLGTSALPIVANTSYGVLLRVLDDAELVEVVVEGQTRISTSDPNPLPPGRAGLLSGTGPRSQYDGFFLVGRTVSLPSFVDDFDACTSSTDLGARWDVVSGVWYCRDGRARGESTLGLALARAASVFGDVEVDARVQLNGTASGSGIVARATANTYYALRIQSSGRLEIVRVIGATEQPLGSIPVTVTPNVSRRLTLQVTGNDPVSLVGFVDGEPVIDTVDDSPLALASGATGLLSGSPPRSQFDDFSARPLGPGSGNGVLSSNP